jgi:cell division protein FtsQ
MEIRTTNKPRETEATENVPPPDRARYLRRQAPQKLRRTYRLSRVLVTGSKITARVAVVLGIAGVLGATVYYTFTSSRFNVDSVRARGNHHVDPSEIERIVRTSFPSNLLRIDLAQLRDRIEQLTWARRAEVRRVLPAELIVEIEERRPAVILEIRGDLMIADSDGILLDRYDEKYGKIDMPVFRGLLGDSAEGYRRRKEENSERVRVGLRLLAELESGSENYARSISEIDVSDPQNLRVLLVDDTAEIEIGSRDFLKRFRGLMNSMRKYQELKEQYGEIASVDLRYDGQILYRPRKNEAERTQVAARP